VAEPRRSSGANQRALRRFLSVGQVERVIEVRRVRALVVLDDGFQLVQGLDGLRLGGACGFVFVPQRQEFGLQVLRQRLHQRDQVLALVCRLRARRGLRHRRDIPMQGLAEVMHHTDLEHALEVQRRQAVLQHHGQQAQPPGVLGRAFAPSFGGMSAAQHVLEPFGRLDEAQPVNQVLVGHGADSGTTPPVNQHTTFRVATIGVRHNHSREDTP
jgi:hypothetical protein